MGEPNTVDMMMSTLSSIHYNRASDVRVRDTYIPSKNVACILWRRKCCVHVACGYGVRPHLEMEILRHCLFYDRLA